MKRNIGIELHGSERHVGSITGTAAICVLGGGRMSAIWKRVRPWCLPVGLTLLVFILLRYVFLIGYVPTESMEPTLPKGSFILGFRIFEEPKVGDIIVFEKDGALLVKRIAAGPGDRVDLSQLTYMTSLPIPVWEETIIAVPEGCYYVLVDNTQNSWDSRYWEYTFVLRSDIVAVVIPKESLIYTKT